MSVFFLSVFKALTRTFTKSELHLQIIFGFATRLSRKTATNYELVGFEKFVRNVISHRLNVTDGGPLRVAFQVVTAVLEESILKLTCQFHGPLMQSKGALGL